MQCKLLNYLSNHEIMKIALIGHGGMGRTVERVAKERDHEIAVIVDPGKGVGLDKLADSGASVVIDFSLGEAVMENIKACTKLGLPIVVGSTGWYEKMDEVKAATAGIPFMWSSNFSIGVNLYFKIVEAAAQMMDRFDEYDVWGHEIHHVGKADSPSGTAKTLEKILLDNLSRKTAVVEDKLDRKREENEIHFSSVRGGLVNFGHTIAFDSAADRISISHEARCRDGYALGAVKAAEWLAKQPVGHYEMRDFLNL